MFHTWSTTPQEELYVRPYWRSHQLWHLFSCYRLTFNSRVGLNYNSLTFISRSRSRGIGIQSTLYARCFSLFLDLNLISHFLFQVLKLSGDGGRSPWSINFINLYPILGISQLNSLGFILGAHVDVIKYEYNFGFIP